MKKIITLIICLALGSNVFAQTEPASNELGIALATYLPPQAYALPEPAKSLLSDKMNQMVTQNGLGGDYLTERFLITVNVAELTKTYTSSVPSMLALNLGVTFYIGDGIAGTKFASTYMEVKGVGGNETQAYISAIRNINVNASNFEAFFATGRSRIIQYFSSHCDQILKDAQLLIKKGNYDGALAKLTSIPPQCKSCYVKTTATIPVIYKKASDNTCQVKLSKARSVWAANQNYDSANEAADIVSKIDPRSSCFGEAKALVAQIREKIKQIDNRDWAYALKEQKTDQEIIRTARDIGVAYARNQAKNVAPSVAWNISGWFRI